VNSVAPFSITVVLSGGNQSGGGYHQALTNLRMLLTSLPDDISLNILDSRGSFAEDLRQLDKEGLLSETKVLSLPHKLPTFTDRVLTSPALPYQIARGILRLAGRNVKSSLLARFLDTSECDLVYFAGPVPEAAELMMKPYIWTLWDLAHLDHPEFPEVRTSGKFEAREDFISRAIRKASLLVVDSAELMHRAHTYFGVNEKKCVVIPFTPPSSRSIPASQKENLPSEVDSVTGRYFFYPAQLWTHKNHLRIAEALAKLNAQGNDYHAVFVGADHGAGPSIRRGIETLGIGTHIHFLGYVDDSAIPALYKNSLALVMASYFGPTNIPPLEAMLLETPVLASHVHRDQLAEAALYFDPDNADDLADIMAQVTQPATRKRLIAAGKKRLKDLDASRMAGQRDLAHRITALSKRILRP